MEQPTFDNFDDGGHISPRWERAKDILDTHPNGVIKVYTTTQSDAARTIAMEAMGRGEKSVILEPTNRILEHTGGHIGSDFRRVHKNKECPHNVKLCEEYPDLRALETLPLPGDCGRECEYYEECDVVSPIRDGWSVLGVTYAKLCTLVASQYGRYENIDDEPSTPKLLLDELSFADNYILDECQVLAGGNSKNRLVAAIGEGEDTRASIERQTQEEGDGIFDRFESIQTTFPSLHQLAVQYGNTLQDDDMREHMVTVAERAIGKEKTECWSIKTGTGRRISPERDHIAMMLRDLVRLMKEREKYGLSVRDVVFLQQVHWIMISQWVSIAAKWERGHVVVKIHALDNLVSTFLHPFLNQVSWEGHEREENRRIIMTSATFVDHNYKQYVWKGSKIAEYWWNDPSNSNRRHLILCDSSKYQAWGKGKRPIGEYVRFIRSVVGEYGEENVAVVAISKRLTQELSNRLGRDIEVDHYRSKWHMGIGTKKRILITVGAGYTPSNTFDPVAVDLDDSKRMRLEAMRESTANAWGRGKDPWGSEPSIVFALGVTQGECRDIFTWGIGRKLEGEKWTPRCSRELSKPSIKKCSDWNMMTEYAKHHLKPNYRARMKMKEEGLREKERELYKKYHVKRMLLDNKYINNEPSNNNSATSSEESTVSEAENSLSIVYTTSNIREISSSLTEYSYDDVNASQTLSASKIYLDFRNKYAYDSLTASSDHFLQNIQKVFVSRNKTYTNVLTFLEEAFMPRYDYWNTATAKRDSPGEVEYAPFYARCEEDAKRSFFTWLDAHLRGTKALVISALDRSACGIWGCFDVDAHYDPRKVTSAPYLKKRYEAELKVDMLCNFMDECAIPYLLEASGSLSSYHVWLFFERCGGKLIRSFMESIAREAGVEGIEINPKQAHHSSKKRAGNGVRIPFGKHQEHFAWSRILVGGKWISRDEFKEVTIETIDISQFDPDIPALTRIRKAPADTVTNVLGYPEQDTILDGKVYRSMESIEDASGSGEYAGIRRFFLWLLTQDLSGEQGHWARIYLAREFLNAGWAYEKIAALFEHQGDYDFDESLKAVKYIAGKDYGNIRYESIWLRCPSFAEKYEDETGHRLPISE